MTPLAEMITELEGLLAKATPGPWIDNGNRLESKDEHGWVNDGWIVAEFDGPDAMFNVQVAALQSAMFPAMIARVRELELALRRVMIGGYHLACIIGNHPPAGTDIEIVQKHYLPHHTEKYEAWCCWNTIMDARKALADKEV